MDILGIGNTVAIYTAYPAYIFIASYFLLDYIPTIVDIIILIIVLIGVFFIAQPEFIFEYLESSNDEDDTDTNNSTFAVGVIICLTGSIIYAIGLTMISKMKQSTDIAQNNYNGNVTLIIQHIKILFRR